MIPITLSSRRHTTLFVSAWKSTIPPQVQYQHPDLPTCTRREAAYLPTTSLRFHKPLRFQMIRLIQPVATSCPFPTCSARGDKDQRNALADNNSPRHPVTSAPTQIKIVPTRATGNRTMEMETGTGTVMASQHHECVNGGLGILVVGTKRTGMMIGPKMAIGPILIVKTEEAMKAGSLALAQVAAVVVGLLILKSSLRVLSFNACEFLNPPTAHHHHRPTTTGLPSAIVLPIRLNSPRSLPLL